MKKSIVLLATLAVFQVSAATHEIRMLNKGKNGENMVFEPNFLKVNKGDSVKFIPTDKSHSVESFKGGLPAGVKDWKGGLNKEITVKMDVEGVHVFKCLPHYAMGMIGAIQVGNPSNLDQIKALKVTGKPSQNFAKILSQIK